jgi:hypothetical protein
MAAAMTRQVHAGGGRRLDGFDRNWFPEDDVAAWYQLFG